MSLALALRAALLLAAGLIVCRWLGNAPAATRHGVRRLTVVLTLALPLISIVSPAWTASDWVSATAPSAAEAAFQTRVPHQEAAGRHWLALAPALASTGSLVVSLFFAAGYLRMAQVRRRARPAPQVWLEAAARLSARMHLPRVPPVLVASECVGPCVTGVFRPAVIIPGTASGWSDARRDAVLLHELAHLRRGDLRTQLLAQAVVALHWFNPLAWITLAEMRRERERACDEAVVGAGIAPLAYAAELVAIATSDATPAPALHVARVPELEGRLRSLLAPPVPGPGTAAACGASLAIMCACVAVAGATNARPERPAQRTWSAVHAGTLMPQFDEEPDREEAIGSEVPASPAAREHETTMLAFTSGAHVIPALLDALSAPEPGVREKAAVGLAWRRDARIGPALVKAAADSDPDVREKVLVALAFSSAPEASRIIAAAKSDPDAGVREKAEKLSIFR